MAIQNVAAALVMLPKIGLTKISVGDQPHYIGKIDSMEYISDASGKPNFLKVNIVEAPCTIEFFNPEAILYVE